MREKQEENIETEVWASGGRPTRLQAVVGLIEAEGASCQPASLRDSTLTRALRVGQRARGLPPHAHSLQPARASLRRFLSRSIGSNGRVGMMSRVTPTSLMISMITPHVPSQQPPHKCRELGYQRA